MSHKTSPNGSPASKQTSRQIPDLTASIVTQQSGKNKWTPFLSVNQVGEGYFKGEDKDGNTTIVQTHAAYAVATGQPSSANDKRIPDLLIYYEVEEDGDRFWVEILAAWKGKDGYFTGKNADGHSVVIQTREAKEASFKNRKPRRIAAVNFNAETLT